jgi:hypothetical protein
MLVQIVSETVERACDRLKPQEPDTPRTTRQRNANTVANSIQDFPAAMAKKIRLMRKYLAFW